MQVSNETAQTVKSQLGRIITHLPEKTEDWLMVTLEDQCRMWFRGESAKPLAIVEVKVFGNKIDRKGSERMTQEVCALFQKELGVDPKDCMSAIWPLLTGAGITGISKRQTRKRLLPKEASLLEKGGTPPWRSRRFFVEL